ncbi:MAG: TolC family protein [Tannerellaceae bacterium]|jgi:outer membrane protein TolC|nr:TolC family protein [Tannerellaceae bacterium]
MKTIILTAGLFFASLTLNAQDAQAPARSVLALIEENNTTLQSLREAAGAQKLENRAGIFPDNPEVGFSYLWGNPASTGNRTDFSLVQRFDIPTITGMKRSLAAGRDRLAEWQYKAARMDILLQARRYCIELAWYNALAEELDARLGHAAAIASACKERLDRGDASLVEYNKAELNLSTLRGEIARAGVEREALLSHLERLNGGIPVELADTRLNEGELPPDFDAWYTQAGEKSPVLAWVKQEVELGKKQVSLSRAMALPSFSAGYMSEQVVGQRYGGITLGVSVPLWGNRNRVRQAKAALKAAEARQTDSRQQFYSRLQGLYKRAQGLRKTAAAYRQALLQAGNAALLGKALEAGEISLLQYLQEMSLYYNTVDRALEAEKEYSLALAELWAVEL